MRIRVTREFAGRITHEQRIYPGEYGLEDDVLFGVGQYLLDNGFAVIPGDPEPVPQPAPAPRVIDEIENDGRIIQRLAPESDSDDAIPDDTTVAAPDDEPYASDVSGETVESAPMDYAAWTVSELLAEIAARDIDMKDGEGSGSKGAHVKSDYVLILESDDGTEGQE